LIDFKKQWKDNLIQRKGKLKQPKKKFEYYRYVLKMWSIHNRLIMIILLYQMGNFKANFFIKILGRKVFHISLVIK